MLRFTPSQALAAAAAIVAGLALALAAGASLLAVLCAVAGGALAAFLLVRQDPGQVRAESVEKDEGPALPATREILDALSQPLLIVRSGRVLAANRAARHILGEHIEGADVRLAIRHPAAAERLAKGRQVDQLDPPIELVGLGDQDRRWNMTTVPLSGDDMLVGLTDTSEIHAAERMRSDFVANASHELRTPLATLLGFLETLQDRDVVENEAKRSRFLQIMFGEAKRMQQLVEDLMSLSRIEAKRFSMPREPVELLPLVKEAWSNLRPLREKKGVNLAIEEPAHPAIVAGDRPQILQLVMNLMENAVRYGREGSTVTIGIGESASDMIRFSVADQGEGVAAEHLPHLTRRFYRVDPGRSRAEGGTGLGLAIVKHIVERHRGRLEIASTVGEGTIVTVFIPRANSFEPLS
ncbi:sensor histidine kinase [Sphingosinicella rhizophila]|uniref:histidine kinase n=1 Tax=Sphingosinicella rhizophila TaxID=3050082 RepID=A0ABU3Q4U5_9SPHN|nr:ATP-binding protein [Sphingosinicella sp. GR2756]MDT9598432.1 ATP-binding protein [Sphingosinicella sp. GR2756]